MIIISGDDEDDLGDDARDDLVAGYNPFVTAQ